MLAVGFMIARARDHQHRTFLGIGRCDRIALRGVALHQRGGAGADAALAGHQHGDGIDDGAADMRLQFSELFEIIPAIEFFHLHHPGADKAAEAGMADHRLRPSIWDR